MEPKYIQLPPLPSDMPTELIEIVWGFARMEESERKKFLDYMRENVKPGVDEREKEELLKMMGGIRRGSKPLCRRIQFANAGFNRNIGCTGM